MGIRKVRIFPDPMLRKKARPIRRVDDSIRKLARDMVATMQLEKGVGLAANQVGVLKRLVTIQLPEEDPRIFVNPEITRREGEREVHEGCLSVPGYTGLINRSVKIRARALDEWGSKFRISAEDLLAQAIEHEIDHLNGILFLDHLESHEDLWRNEEVEENGAHLHDVNIEVRVDSSNEGNALPLDGGGNDRHARAATGRDCVETEEESRLHEEILAVKARLSAVTSEVSMGDLSYDLSSAVERPQTSSEAGERGAAG